MKQNVDKMFQWLRRYGRCLQLLQLNRNNFVDEMNFYDGHFACMWKVQRKYCKRSASWHFLFDILLFTCHLLVDL